MKQKKFWKNGILIFTFIAFIIGGTLGPLSNNKEAKALNFFRVNSIFDFANMQKAHANFQTNLVKKIAQGFGPLVVSKSVNLFLMNSEKKGKNSTDWKAYSPSDQRFDIQFPTDPKETSQELVIANKKIQYHELSTESKDSIYAVSYLDFPGHWKILGTNKLLTKSFDAYLENEQNIEKLQLKELSNFQGLTALNYHLKQQGKEIKGKFVIVGNTLYRITVTYPLAAAEKIQSENFFDSFQVKS